MTLVGQGLDRVDGPLKVCGQARYTGDIAPARLAHAVMVTSTVASGRIARIDTEAAQRAPGVVAVITHLNAMRLPQQGRGTAAPPVGRVLPLLQDDRVVHSHQPVALVVAETIGQAMGAAALVRVTYAPAEARLDFAAERLNAYRPATANGRPPESSRGQPAAAFDAAARKLELEYATPYQHHNPMEPHATLAAWEGEQLTVEDSTQFVAGVRTTLCKAMGLAPERVRVRSAFVGGAFGGKGSAWSHVVLAAMAARQVGRPVRLVLRRPQLFGPVGGRPATAQTVRAACDEDGRFVALEHRSDSTTSFLEDWTETCAFATRSLYACPNLATSHRLVRLNVGTPTYQRAPGESTGMFALESAVDELAHTLGIDPVDLRLRNDAVRDEDSGLPFSTRLLAECLRTGAQRIGWSRRGAQPGQRREGDWLVGLGCASSSRPTRWSPCKARVRVTADGQAVVQSSTAEMGTGTYTAMAQVAADALGLPIARVRFELGDTAMPEAPISAGSMTMESVGSAVHEVCLAARAQLVELARGDDGSPLHGLEADAVLLEDGWLRARAEPARRELVAVLLTRNGGRAVEADTATTPDPQTKKYSTNAYGAVFVEVHVDRDLGLVRVPRVVGVYDVGRVVNAKTAHSQLLGGIVWGLSQALMEASLLDLRTGRFVNGNFAEYHVPVNADIGGIEIEVVSEADPHANPLGAKGLGEVSMTGVAAAVANAVFNATGRRIRELPVTLDKLL